VLVAPGNELSPEHFPVQRMASTLPLHTLASDGARPPAIDSSDAERERVLGVLAECGGNQSRAAKELGISRTTLVTRLNGYGVPRPRKP
jgi:two-component system response regulator AtoC